MKTFATIPQFHPNIHTCKFCEACQKLLLAQIHIILYSTDISFVFWNNNTNLEKHFVDNENLQM